MNVLFNIDVLEAWACVLQSPNDVQDARALVLIPECEQDGAAPAWSRSIVGRQVASQSAMGANYAAQTIFC